MGLPATDARRALYQHMYDTQKVASLQAQMLPAVGAINTGNSAYRAVESLCRIPWQVVGVVHQREASGNFATHLANGDPLSARTAHVPKGLPKNGEPPYTWMQGAVAALDDFASGWNIALAATVWDIPTCLLFLECYNGLAYRKEIEPDQYSPYLWAGTQFYQKGYFGADGQFDSELVCRELGGAALLKAMNFEGQTVGFA